MQQSSWKGIVLGLLLAGAGWDARAQSPAAAALSGVQLASLRTQVRQFQASLNRGLQNTLDHPFAMLQDVKGVYLPRFGAVFHMELNLAPLRVLSAFDVRPYTEEELRQARQTKIDRIRILKERLSELLREHGAELSAVPPDQNVAVVVHLFHMPSEQTDGLPTQIVIEVSRGVLADPQGLAVSAEEFRKKISVFEF
ncbi:MAG TPA: hypothetical protein VNN17_04085 [Terriglobia bacterium]|nr:hypothetical protein [Terriglobia bacterium]